MAVTSHLYTMASKSLVDKILDLDSDALKVLLLSSYTIGGTQDSAQFVNQVVTAGVGVEVAAGGGYATGGLALSGVTFTKSGHVYTLDFNDPLWTPNTTITASHAVFYDSTPGSYATDPLIAFWDFGGSQASSSADFKLTVDVTGLLTMTGA